MAARRPYGTGSLKIRGGTYYGRFRVGGQLVRVRLGPVRQDGSREGLTQSQAERELRPRMEADVVTVGQHARRTVEEAGRQLLEHLEGLGRKRSTLDAYESALRVHLAPFFGSGTLDRIGRDDVERFIARSRRSGASPKSTLNYIGFLHSIFDFAQKRGWAQGNPCKLVDRPRADDGDAEIRFLDSAELEALLRAVPEDPVGATERALYLTAAMTGLRQGELFALRWMDVDWAAGRVRVRRSYVRGEFGTPKSKRSSRAVPLANRVAGELDRHFQRSSYTADADLVFPHPLTGKPLDRSKVLKRYKQALRRAGVREVRFHDLRHTFGTRMAAAGVPLRTLQEWLGHRDFKTTLVYADYQPDSGREGELVERAFSVGHNSGHNLSETESTSEHLTGL